MGSRDPDSIYDKYDKGKSATLESDEIAELLIDLAVPRRCGGRKCRDALKMLDPTTFDETFVNWNPTQSTISKTYYERFERWLEFLPQVLFEAYDGYGSNPGWFDSEFKDGKFSHDEMSDL